MIKYGFSHIFLYNKNVMKIKKLNFSDITSNPIDNFYLKFKKELPGLIDNIFKGYYEKNKNESLKYSQSIKNIEQNLNDLKAKKKELKITAKKAENVFIIIGCVFIVGFFFLKKFKENRKVIKQFNDYKKGILNLNSELENEKKLAIQKFFYNFNLSNCIEEIANQFGLRYRNYLFKNEYDIINNHLKPLWIDNVHVYLYKTSPIVDISYKLLEIRDVTTSNSETYSYTDTVYEDGQYRTVVRTEVLTAYHHEPTPFIEDYENLMYLTHFNPDLNFNINNKKYLKFENNDFSKAYKINNTEKSLTAPMLEFFTIKSQEDYTNWYKQNNKKIIPNFSKFGNVIDITNASYKFNSDINKDLNNFSLINFNDNIENNINKFKDILNEYFENLLNSITYGLLSPMISREAYSSKDNNYRISNVQTDDNTILNEKIDYNELDFYSIVSKIYKPSFISFLSNTPKKPEWISIQKVSKYDEYFLIDCFINSYRSENLSESVLVSGNSGSHYIDVPFERFYEIKERKQIFFIPIESKNIPNFSISHTLSFIFGKNNPDFANSWLKNVPFWTNSMSYFKESKNQEIIDIINTISKNLPNSISILKIDEGIAIINNNVNADNNQFIDIIKKTVYRLKNL